CIMHCRHLLGDAGNRIERSGDTGLQRLTLRCEDQTIWKAFKQLKAQPVLKQPHYSADGGLRDVQLVAGGGKASVTRCRLKGTQAVERGESAHSPSFPWPKAKINAFAQCQSNAQLGLVHVGSCGRR